MWARFSADMTGEEAACIMYACRRRTASTGQKLVGACVDALAAEHINKINLIAFKKNEVGNRFWQGLGWTFREDVNYYEYVTNEDNITTYNP